MENSVYSGSTINTFDHLIAWVKMTYTRIRLKSGFTIIELAIVLLITGVLTAGGIRMINAGLNVSRFTATKNQVEAVIKEISENAATAHKIPANITELSEIISPITDDFGNSLIYIADDTLSSDSICNADKTNLQVKICSDHPCTSSEIIDNVAFFVASNSLNGLKQIDDSANVINLYNDSVTVNGKRYDDITGWLTLDSLKGFAACDSKNLSIIEDKLPQVHTMSDYNYTLHPKGGKSPYLWCAESTDESIRKNFTFAGADIYDAGECAGKPYSETGIPEIRSSYNTDEYSESIFPAGTKLQVYLKDNSGTKTDKLYVLRIAEDYRKQEYLPGGVEVVQGGEINGFESFMDEPDKNGNGSDDDKTDYYIDHAENELKLLQNHDTNAVTAFYGCGSDDHPTVSCPKFGNNGLLSTYFTVEYSKKTNSWRIPMGFTFAVIRSRYERENGTSFTTERAAGQTRSGLGYGGRCQSYASGIPGGNSFAVEFDLYMDRCENDINNNHIAIDSYSKVKDGNGRYSSYGNVVHKTSHSDTLDIFNQACVNSGLRGTGCFYDRSRDAIPNNYGTNDANLFGVRIEAVSGCNENGTECNQKTGTENHICVYMWKEMVADMRLTPSLEVSMTNVSKYYAYDKAVNGIEYPMGEPVVMDCIEDDTTSRNTLDYIRFGFTTGTLQKGNNDFFFKFSDFKAVVSEYN